jgi:hypothetical protein
VYLLIHSSEDGEPITPLNEAELAQVLRKPEEWSIRKFGDSSFFHANASNTNYWEEGTAVLLKVEVLIPTPVTTAWTIK